MAINNVKQVSVALIEMRGGYLIASIFNGPGEKLNLVPMDGNLNK